MQGIRVLSPSRTTLPFVFPPLLGRYLCTNPGTSTADGTSKATSFGSAFWSCSQSNTWRWVHAPSQPHSPQACRSPLWGDSRRLGKDL